MSTLPAPILEEQSRRIQERTHFDGMYKKVLQDRKEVKYGWKNDSSGMDVNALGCCPYSRSSSF